MPYAEYHRKEKERERGRRRNKLRRKNNPNWNKGKNNPMYGKHRVGKENPNWKGGFTELKRKIRDTLKYKIWRSNIFERDNWTCQTCNKKSSGDLEVHHKKSIKRITEEFNIQTIEEAIKCEYLWDITNGITLCEECHRIVHKIKKF